MSRVLRNSSNEEIRVGMKVGRIDNYKRNGVVKAINTDDHPRTPVLVRWPNLDDVWMHPEILTITPTEGDKT